MKKNLMVPVHIRMPFKMLEAIEREARGRHGRSGWVRTAIQTRLDGNDDNISNASTRQLMAALSARDDVDKTLAQLLMLMLTE